MTVGLPYIDRFADRHGHWRYYFRRPGGPRIPLPGNPGSQQFLDAYRAAATLEPVEKPAKTRGQPGTFDRLCAEYYSSPGFLKMKESTRGATRRYLDRFCEEHGHRLVAQLKRKHVEAIIGARAETPVGANNLLKKLRALMTFAIKNEWRDDDPTATVDRFKEGTYHTWTEDEIARFRDHWPFGSRERTAFALALYTGQRRADLAAVTWTAYDRLAGNIRVAQEKGEMERNDEDLLIPVHAELKQTLDAWPRSNVVILATSRGKPFSVAGFGNMMADAIAAAGLPDRCVLHGLRKAAARRLAEAGCTSKQIASITGHKSLEEVERYTARADQRTLARAAVTRLEEHFKDKDSQPDPKRLGKKPKT